MYSWVNTLLEEAALSRKKQKTKNNLGIPGSLIYAQYRKLQYSSSNNIGNTSIVKHTILEAPVFFIQQYW
jgi:hypothetical protein